MFTGIIERTHNLLNRVKSGNNIDFHLSSEINSELKVDQSISHNGVCLTITSLDEKGYWVTAVDETLQKTNLKNWQKGDLINIERSLQLGDRLDGHMVQGHVDTLAQCTSIEEIDGSWLFEFQYDSKDRNLLVPKGSITINGVSLTLIEAGEQSFSVTIIPYTYHHTNFATLQLGDQVNIEFDILGKYIQRMLASQLQ